MKSVLRLLAAMIVAAPSLAWGQSAVLQAGSAIIPGHAPMYLQGGSQAIIQDSGSAGGGLMGFGFSEMLFQERGSGTAPFANAGTGPNHENICDWDAPNGPSNANGAHYMCLSPNAQGGGLISFGAVGAAPPLPTSIMINGTLYPFPGAGNGNVVGPTSPYPTAGNLVIWNSGTAVEDTGNVVALGITVPSIAGQTFFTDQAAPHPNVMRLGDRATLGYTNADPLVTHPTTGQLSWAGANTSSGDISYIEQLAALSVYPENGGVGVGVAVRASDYPKTVIGDTKYFAEPTATFALCDIANSQCGNYMESRTVSTTGTAFGLEIDAGNFAGPPPTTNPYQQNNIGASYSLQLNSGGDPGTPGTVYNSSYALGIAQNKSGSAFLNGISFNANALFGCNGVSYTPYYCVAINFAKSDEIRWTDDTGGDRGAWIRADTPAGAANMGMVFTTGEVVFAGENLTTHAETVEHLFDNLGNYTANGIVTAKQGFFINGNGSAIRVAYSPAQENSDSWFIGVPTNNGTPNSAPLQIVRADDATVEFELGFQGQGLFGTATTGGLPATPGVINVAGLQINGVAYPSTITLTGDTTGTGTTSIATTTVKVNGVTYPSSPSLNTVPVVTNAAGGGTMTYELLPNSAMANPTINIAGHLVSLGGTQAIAAADLTAISGGSVIGNPTTGSANPSVTLNPVLGIAGSNSGTLGLAAAGTGGQVVTLEYFGTTAYNWIYPAGPGTSGQVLQSQGNNAALQWLTLATVATAGTYASLTDKATAPIATSGTAATGALTVTGAATVSGLITGANIRLVPVTYSALGACSGPVEGTLATLTDSLTATWGTTISGGGGPYHVLAYCDSAHWTVAGG